MISEINYKIKNEEESDFQLYKDFGEITDAFCRVYMCGNEIEKADFITNFVHYLAHPAVLCKNYAVIDTVLNSFMSEM